MNDRQHQLQERLDAELATHGEPEPPWARYPTIERGSIGWRMGYGESYAMLWDEFVRTHLRSMSELVTYLQRHPPAPRTWTDDLVAWLTHVDTEDTSDEESLLAMIETERLVGDDVAYPVFVRNAMRDGGMPPPWMMVGAKDGPADALRYCAREVGWWARWLATGCTDRLAYLDSHPPSSAWKKVAAAVRAGHEGTPWADLDAGADVLIVAMALHGVMPPPWLHGHAPLHELDWPDQANNLHRWSWWVFATFEDAASWSAYLARWPPPPAWRTALDEELFSELCPQR